MAGTRTKKRGNGLVEKVKSVDIFGEDIGLTVKDGQRTYTTVLGALASFILFTVTLLYGVTKYSSLVDYSEVSFKDSVVKHGALNDSIPVNQTDISFTYAIIPKNIEIGGTWDLSLYDERTLSAKAVLWSFEYDFEDPLNF